MPPDIAGFHEPFHRGRPPAIFSCCRTGWYITLAVGQGGLPADPGGSSQAMSPEYGRSTRILIGGNCGVYEGTVVKKQAVLGTGTILNRSTPVYDLVRGEVYRATDDQPLVVPEGAVLIAGSRAVTSGPGKDWGISIYTPVIVKYRDEKTGAKIQLEDLLR